MNYCNSRTQREKPDWVTNMKLDTSLGVMRLKMTLCSPVKPSVVLGHKCRDEAFT